MSSGVVRERDKKGGGAKKGREWAAGDESRGSVEKQKSKGEMWGNCCMEREKVGRMGEKTEKKGGKWKKKRKMDGQVGERGGKVGGGSKPGTEWGAGKGPWTDGWRVEKNGEQREDVKGGNTDVVGTEAGRKEPERKTGTAERAAGDGEAEKGEQGGARGGEGRKREDRGSAWRRGAGKWRRGRRKGRTNGGQTEDGKDVFGAEKYIFPAGYWTEGQRSAIIF